jgi:hypothetical protein
MFRGNIWRRRRQRGSKRQRRRNFGETEMERLSY